MREIPNPLSSLTESLGKKKPKKTLGETWAPLQQIFQKNNFIQLQQDLKNNTPNNYCSGCYKIESTAPGSSQWSAFNTHFKRQESSQSVVSSILY